MKRALWLLAPAVLLLCPPVLSAQAPAGATGQCNDGSYTTAASKSGACRGHKGIQTWYAPTTAKSAPAPPPAAAATPAPNPAPTPKPAVAAPAPAAASSSPSPKGPAAQAAARTQAPGGGPGMVWVNTSTKVYHCSGSQFYGKTKDGKYMSEADAKAAGAHPDHNKPCSK